MRISKVLLGVGVAMTMGSAALAQTDTLQGSGIRVRKDASLSWRDTGAVAARDTGTAVTTSYSTGDVETSFAGWVDGNIIHYVIVGDSMEVELARLAETRAASAEVRDFARMLLTDHSAYLAEDLEMSKDEDLGRAASPTDYTLTRLTTMWNELSGLNGSAFDRAFLRHIAMKHQSSIAAYRTLEPSARDDDLEKLLEDRVPLLERHLNRAREIAGTLNVDLNMTTPSSQTGGTTRYPN
jgi:putative membrane protein